MPAVELGFPVMEVMRRRAGMSPARMRRLQTDLPITRSAMSVLPFAAPLMVLVSAVWTVVPLLCIRRRRTGLVLSASHLGVTVVILRPWAVE
ncbi:hypothetical protein [Streptomyces omiyaensis]|nr:hypothetical protein [Streptomyces omiyaensis]